MHMDATGRSRGQWIFHGEFNRTVAYLSDQQKLMSFNPFCHSVERLDNPDAFRWRFRVTDPQNNPFDVIFNVLQESEVLIELPEEEAEIDPETLSAEKLDEYTVGMRITWRQYQVPEKLEEPEKYLFEGKATGDMLLVPLSGGRTRVDFDLRIDVSFILYPAFRVVPEKVVRSMVSAGMSLIMQTSTNRMFHKISKDFGLVRQM